MSTEDSEHCLLSLPSEILNLILEELEWDEVLNIRQSSEALEDPTKERSLWVSLLNRYLDTSIPRPFFLPKPLENCNSQEIEDTVVGWWTAPAPNDSNFPGVLRPEVANLPSILHPQSEFGPFPKSFCPLQTTLAGGRFILYHTSEGDVWYHDSEAPLSQPRLLIPSPLASQCLQLGEHYSVDARFGVDTLVGLRPASSRNRLDELLFPQSFNVFVLFQLIFPAVHLPGGVVGQVWRLSAQLQDGSLHGYEPQLLAEFDEDPYCATLCGCAILENEVAYALSYYGGESCATVVTWTNLVAKSGFDHICVPGPSRKVGCPRIALLPGQRILVMDWLYLKVFHWGSITPTTESKTGVSHLVHFSGLYADDTKCLLWCHALETGIWDGQMPDFDASPLFFIHDSVRVV